MTDSVKISGSENIIFVCQKSGEVVDVLDGRDFDYNIRKHFYGHATFSKTCMSVMSKVIDALDLTKFDHITAFLICNVKIPEPIHGFCREQVKVRQVIYDKQ